MTLNLLSLYPPRGLVQHGFLLVARRALLYHHLDLYPLQSRTVTIMLRQS